MAGVPWKANVHFRAAPSYLRRSCTARLHSLKELVFSSDQLGGPCATPTIDKLKRDHSKKKNELLLTSISDNM